MSKKGLRTLNDLAQHNLITSNELPALRNVTEEFSVAITHQMRELITHPDDPIAKQFVPSIKELEVITNESRDPIGDDVHTKIKGIVHRYPDRCLFMPVLVCPVYCRFCFRKEKVGEAQETLAANEISAAINYIREHPEIWEVILTGGDPFILKPATLKKIIQQLNAIPHVEIIRFHTRIPVVDSERINAELINALKCDKTLYVLLHANHAKEFTPAAVQACAAIIDAGIPMLSQTVLLKGINDNIEALSDLMRCFVKNRIKPFYLHHCDLARGTQHFRTTIAEGQRLMKELRGRFSGLCQPTYVLDIPGGHGKVPIGPSYIDDGLVEDYQTNSHPYSD